MARTFLLVRRRRPLPRGGRRFFRSLRWLKLARRAWRAASAACGRAHQAVQRAYSELHRLIHTWREIRVLAREIGRLTLALRRQGQLLGALR